MANETTKVTLAIRKISEQTLIRQNLENVRDFAVDSIPLGYQLSDLNFNEIDIVIACNATLDKYPSFQFKNLNTEEHRISTFAALSRRQLRRSAENLSRVNGCILLDGNLKLIANALRLAKRGYSVFPNKLGETFIDFGMEEMWTHNLQLDECLILNELAVGVSEKEIFQRLGLSNVSLQHKKETISAKLRITNFADLKPFALRHKEALHDRRRHLIQQTNTAPTRRRSNR